MHHHHCNTTTSAPVWACFTKYVISFFLCIFCPTFLPFPPDASFHTWTFVTTTATQHLQCQLGLGLPSMSSRSFFVSSALLSYLSPPGAYFYAWAFVTTAATQHLRCQIGLGLPSMTSRSFFASSALLSYLSRQTLPFIRGPLSPLLRHNIFNTTLALLYQGYHPALSLYPLPYFLTFPTRPSFLHTAVSYHRCNTTSSVPAWAWFTKCVIPFFLRIFCSTFLPFPPDASFCTWHCATAGATQHL
jgi:hypothetical protein